MECSLTISRGGSSHLLGVRGALQSSIHHRLPRGSASFGRSATLSRCRLVRVVAENEGRGSAKASSGKRRAKSSQTEAGAGAGAGAPKQKQVQVESEGVPTPPRAAEPSYPGTPLFWVGVGVGLSVLFNWVSKKIYQQAQQAMMRQLMEAMKSGGAPPGGASPFGGVPGASPFGGDAANPFGGMPFPGGPPFGGAPSPFGPPPPTTASRGAFDVAAKVTDKNGTATRASPEAPPRASTAAPSSTATPRAAPSSEPPTPPRTPTATPSSVIEPDENYEAPKEPPRRSSFFQDTDVSFESTPSGVSSGGYTWASSASASGSSTNSTGQTSTSGTSTGKGKMTVEALEKMLEDPTIQKMILPYLPEEMRDPATFKWMLQSPIYRSQLEQMLEGGADTGFDPRVVEMMQNFDLNSPDVQQQFSQIGMTPDQVVGRIMSDPKLAAAFQNPRIQAAILDVSTNPYNLAKYANDAEFMEVFQKLQAVFPVQQ